MPISHTSVHLRTGLGAALRLAGLRAGDVVGGNPVGVVGGGGGNCSAAGGLLSSLDLTALGALGALLGGLSSLALLGEVGGDPDGVKEVAGSRDTGQEEEVEEETGSNC